MNFIERYYSDIFENPSRYIEMTEKAIAEYLWWGHVRLVNSGTTAIQLGLLSVGVQPWDEVILPANTYSATAIAITNIGAIPVFADITLRNFTIDSRDIQNKITKKTKAIIPVHLYGYNCAMDEILAIAKQHNLKVIEDASHAFWWEYHGKKLGTLGDVWAFSAHMTKNFWTFGNGGIFFTKDTHIIERLDAYMFPDRQTKEVLRSWRTPANMLAMDAVVLFLKLKHIRTIIDYNRALFLQMKKEFQESDFLFPEINEENSLHIRNFTVLSPQRDQYIEQWLGKQYYQYALHQGDIFSEKIQKLPNTEKFFQENLSLNFYFWKQ